MSQDSVDIARRTVQGWQAFAERGEVAFFDEYYAEDCVSEDFPDLPDGSSYVGRDGVRARYLHFVEAWGDFALEPVEFIDAGGGAVITVVAMTGRGEGSGAPLDFHAFFVWEVRDGKLIRDRAFTSRSDAFAAAGLSDQRPNKT
jgi:ketosteroid isomerase-like protein